MYFYVFVIVLVCYCACACMYAYARVSVYCIGWYVTKGLSTNAKTLTIIVV